MLVLLTGGAANGKSRYAERLAAAYDGTRTYVATMRPDGEDGEERIRRHRRQREGLGFVTLERQFDVAGLAPPTGGLILLECVATLLDNEWFWREQSVDAAVRAVLAGVRHLAEAADVLVVVTNRIEAEGNSYDTDTEAYIRIIAELNETLMEMADAAVEMQVGRPVCLKGQALLRSRFPTAPLGTAVVVDPSDVLANTHGLVLALAGDAAALQALPYVPGKTLTDLDRLLEEQGQRAFTVPFPTYRLITSRFRGDGVIPLEAAARRRREQAGRLLIQIADNAEQILYHRDGVWLLLTPVSDVPR